MLAISTWFGLLVAVLMTANHQVSTVQANKTAAKQAAQAQSVKVQDEKAADREKECFTQGINQKSPCDTLNRWLNEDVKNAQGTTETTQAPTGPSGSEQDDTEATKTSTRAKVSL